MSEIASTPESDLKSPSPIEEIEEELEEDVLETTEVNGDGSQDTDDDVQTKASRKHAAPIEDGTEDDDLPMGDDDLFGSASEGEENRSPKRRRLSDEALDSGDDDGRQNRMIEDDMDIDGEKTEKEVITQNLDLSRHGIPRSSDGELYVLRHPPFVGIEPKAFTASSFHPPTKGHHNAEPTSAFSASQVANSTIRWRRDPDNPQKLQSNARIIRWSDGSLTLQIGSMPMEQHQLPAKPLTSGQSHPIKATPISHPKKSSPYNPRSESHTYLASVHPDVSYVHLTNHLTTSLTVQNTGEDEDDAVTRLQEKLATAAKTDKGGDGQGPGIISIQEDPELAKRKAEIAERDKLRADKRRQNQAERERDRANRVLGRSGLRNGAAGLTIGSLEDDEGMGRGRGAGGRAKGPKRPRRRNSEYSEDEEEGYGRRGKTKEDEYDEDDGFLVGDEEPETYGDSDSEEEEFGEADAEGEEDDDGPTPGDTGSAPAAAAPAVETAKDEDARDEDGARGRRRRVVDDEDE